MWARYVKNKIELNFGFSPTLLKEVKALAGRKWDKEKKCWIIPPTAENIQYVVDRKFRMTPLDAQMILIDLEKDKKHRELLGLRRQLCNAVSAPAIPEVAQYMKLPAKDFQWVSCHYSRLNDHRFILGDAMGVGKSVQGLMISYLPENIHSPVIIVTPAPATYQGELLKFFGAPSVILNTPLYGLNPNVRFYFVTYESLKHLFKHRDPGNNDYQLFDWVKSCIVITDEAQKAKNMSTQIFKHLECISQNVSRYIQMTGTPIMNREEEAYSLLKLWNPHLMSKTQFRENFCGLKYNPSAQEYEMTGKNLPALNQYLFDNCMMRREEDQVIDQLPKKSRQIMSLKQKPIEIEADSILEMYSKNAEIKATDKDFLEWIEAALDQCNKVLLFGHHKIMLDVLEIVCQHKGYKFLRIDGSVDMQERHRLEKLFNSDPSYKAMILSITAAGHALNLQSANIVIFCEFTWTPGQILQAEARSRRMGQENPVLCLYPRISRFENRMIDILLEKTVLIEKSTSPHAQRVAMEEDSLMKELCEEFGIPIRKSQKGVKV